MKAVITFDGALDAISKADCSDRNPVVRFEGDVPSTDLVRQLAPRNYPKTLVIQNRAGEEGPLITLTLELRDGEGNLVSSENVYYLTTHVVPVQPSVAEIRLLNPTTTSAPIVLLFF